MCVLNTVRDKIKSEDDLLNPCEVLCNSEFTVIPQNCSNLCNASKQILESNLKRIGRVLMPEPGFDNVIDFIYFLLCPKNPHLSKLDVYHKIQTVLLENQNNLENFYKGEKEIGSFISDMQITDKSSDFINLALIAAAILLKAVILFVSCTNSPCIQTIIPIGEMGSSNPIVVGFSPHTNVFFHVGEKVMIFNESSASSKLKDLDDSDNATSFCKCTCGRSHKKQLSSCTDKKCPCFRNQQSCSGGSCFNCENKFGRSVMHVQKEKACKCGMSNHMTKDVCKKLRCMCFKNKWSCDTDPVCLCKNCENDFGRKVKNSLKRKSQSVYTKKRECKSAGKMPQLSSKKFFYDHMCLKKKQSIWTEEETLAIFLCNKVAKCIFDNNKTMLAELYNKLSEKCKDMTLRKKSKSQVLSKLRSLASYEEILNK